MKSEQTENQLIETIKKFRKISQLTQDQVALAIGRTRSAYASWEEGKAKPNINDIVSLAELYKVSLDEFVLGRKPENQKNDTEEIDEEENIGLNTLHLIEQNKLESKDEIQQLKKLVRFLIADAKNLSREIRIRDQLIDLATKKK